MNHIQKFMKNIKDNLAEYYTAIVIFIVLPAIIGSMTGVVWGFLLSFLLQATIGIMYIVRINSK